MTTIISFYGPAMRKCIKWAVVRDVNVLDMTAAQFMVWMNNALGTTVTEDMRINSAAETWLAVIDTLP